jgi:hypothetical protein
VCSDKLLAVHTRSCGCLQKEVVSKRTVIDLVGRRFNKFVVMARRGSTPHGKATWLCRCDCGREVVVVSGALLSGNTKSCGCWNSQLAHDRAIKRNQGMDFGVSKVGTKFLDELERLFSVEIEREVVIDGHPFDGRVADILFETDGSYWHGLPRVRKRDVVVQKISSRHGFKLLRFSGIDDLRKISSYVSKYEKCVRDVFLSKGIL